MKRVERRSSGSSVLFLMGALFLPASRSSESDLHARANRALGLARSQMVRLSIQGEVGAPLIVAIDADHEQSLVLDLVPHSVRGAAFRLLVQGEDAAIVSVDPGPVRTLRGQVLGLPGSQVAAALLDDGLYARIRLGDGDHWVQPIGRHVSEAAPEQHLLFRSADVVKTPRTCGTDGAPTPVPFAPDASFGAGGWFDSFQRTAQLACDADYEYYSNYGSSGVVGTRIESVINAMNLQYESEVGIHHEITTILVRSSSVQQPYTATDAGDLLGQFREQWNDHHGSIERDVAHLFTGKELDGNLIGIARIGAVCQKQQAYGLAQSDYNNSFSCATDLAAHELGHNWNAGHCDCPENTMNPFITCANTFSEEFTVPEIVAFRESRPCLSVDLGWNYCMSNPNSTGSAAVIDASVVDDELVFCASPVPDTPGFFYYGRIRIQAPFGGAYRCVGGSSYRSPFVLGAGGEISWAPDLAVPPHDQIVLGTNWNFQAWYRDTQAEGDPFNLSDGLSVTLGP